MLKFSEFLRNLSGLNIKYFVYWFYIFWIAPFYLNISRSLKPGWEICFLRITCSMLSWCFDVYVGYVLYEDLGNEIIYQRWSKSTVWELDVRQLLTGPYILYFICYIYIDACFSLYCFYLQHILQQVVLFKPIIFLWSTESMLASCNNMRQTDSKLKCISMKIKGCWKRSETVG